jgi:hypothetical protein
MLDDDWTGGDPDMIAAQRDQSHHVGQGALVQVASVTVEIITKRLDRATCVTGFGSVCHGSNRLTNLLLIRRVPAARQKRRRQRNAERETRYLKPSNHLKISLRRGLPLCRGYAPMRERMDQCNFFHHRSIGNFELPSMPNLIDPVVTDQELRNQA